MLSSRCWLAFAAILLGVALWCWGGTVLSLRDGLAQLDGRRLRWSWRGER